MDIQKNNLDIPDHLNASVFQTVMGKIPGADGAQVKKVCFKMATPPGNNYTSQIYRVEIKYETVDHDSKTTSVIIKSMPSKPINAPLEKYGIYSKETTMYFKVLPRIKRLFPDIKFAPECYWSTHDPIKTIVFEDLKLTGFRNAPRELGLDMVHAELVIRKLAMYHAATILVCQEDQSIQEALNKPIIGGEILESDLFQGVFRHSHDKVTDVVATWPEFDDIAKKMRKISENYEQRITQCTDPTNDKLKVLSHGDTWITNMLFQYDNEESNTPNDVAFVDFQASYWGSPGIDINYFFNSSLQLEVLEHKREDLIKVYCKTFAASLRKFGYKEVPSEEAIRDEIRSKEFYGFIVLCDILPFICMDPKDSVDNNLEMLADKEKISEKNKVMFQSPRFIQTLRYSLKRFDDLKVLDTL